MIPTPLGQTHLSYRKFAESTEQFWCEFDTHIFIEIWFDRKVACLGEVMSAPFRGHTLVTQRRYYFADKIQVKRQYFEVKNSLVYWVTKRNEQCRAFARLQSGQQDHRRTDVEQTDYCLHFNSSAAMQQYLEPTTDKLHNNNKFTSFCPWFYHLYCFSESDFSKRG